MLTTNNNRPAAAWTAYEKFLFRFIFLYFIIQIIPVHPSFYVQLFSVRWTQLQYGDIFNLAHYTPHFFSGGPTYADWIIVALIALAGAAVWSWRDKSNNTDYNKLFYWLRVLARYRLAIALFTYGFIMLFPIQAPYPSISNLNTPYGDFTRWKLFAMSLGVVPSYEFFLGLVEVLLGLLLLYRKTASIASFIIIIVLGNVFVSNIAYEGGEDVYCLFLISLASVLLAYDAQRIVRLLILQKPTAPNRFKPILALPWQQYGRVALKTVFVLFFVILYGFKTSDGYADSTYQYPQTKGLPGVTGIYNVTTFQLNKDTIAFSPNDPVRWQDVVFESWNTISIRSNRPVLIDSNNVDRIHSADADRRYELEGSAARHYYSYTIDSAQQILTLENRNPHYAGEKLVLHYERQGKNKLLLTGIDQNKDSVTVVLDKIDKKYLLEEAAKGGRRKGLKL